MQTIGTESFTLCTKQRCQIIIAEVMEFPRNGNIILYFLPMINSSYFYFLWSCRIASSMDVQDHQVDSLQCCHLLVDLIGQYQNPKFDAGPYVDRCDRLLVPRHLQKIILHEIGGSWEIELINQ